MKSKLTGGARCRVNKGKQKALAEQTLLPAGPCQGLPSVRGGQGSERRIPVWSSGIGGRCLHCPLG